MLRKPTNQLSIRPKMSTRARLALVSFSIMVLLLSLYFAYSLGMKLGHQQFNEDQTTISELRETIATLEQNINRAENEQVIAERQAQIQQEAYEQISRAYANSEEKSQVLERTLDFYRSIISPADGQSGPAIQDLLVSLDDEVVRFDVTLVQAIEHKRQVRGSLRVEAYRGQQFISQWPQAAPRAVNYQYFSKLSGEMPLTAEDQTGELRMVVSLKLNNGEEITREFEPLSPPAS